MAQLFANGMLDERKVIVGLLFGEVAATAAVALSSTVSGTLSTASGTLSSTASGTLSTASRSADRSHGKVIVKNGRNAW